MEKLNLKSDNKYYHYKNNKTEAIVQCQDIKFGEIVNLIKILNAQRTVPNQWTLGDVKYYKKLTKKQKLELL